MKDYLQDIVKHTVDLGFIDMVKVVGDDTVTNINGIAEDKSVVLEGHFSKPVADFIGTFGMPNLPKLKILLNLAEYQEKEKILLTRRSDGSPDGVQFENATGDFKNNYRFMAAEIITAMLNQKFKGVNWHVEFTPLVASIQRLKMQAQANSDMPNFTMRVENGDLKCSFGDHSTHAGEFVFCAGVKGNLKRAWAWPVTPILSILNSVGDKTFKISDDGAAQITVDSGLAVYNYIIPAQSK